MIGLLSVVPWWGRALALLAVAGTLYGGFRVYRHSVWVEGRNAALEAVRVQNGVAAQAADKVQLTIDQCFDRGGTWDVSKGSCDR